MGFVPRLDVGDFVANWVGFVPRLDVGDFVANWVDFVARLDVGDFVANWVDFVARLDVGDFVANRFCLEVNPQTTPIKLMVAAPRRIPVIFWMFSVRNLFLFCLSF